MKLLLGDVLSDDPSEITELLRTLKGVRRSPQDRLTLMEIKGKWLRIEVVAAVTIADFGTRHWWPGRSLPQTDSVGPCHRLRGLRSAVQQPVQQRRLT